MTDAAPDHRCSTARLGETVAQNLAGRAWPGGVLMDAVHPLSGAVPLSGDEIVVERTWRSGVEIVSRVNWSHIARVRGALGLVGDSLGAGGLLTWRPVRIVPTLVTPTPSPAGRRAA